MTVALVTEIADAERDVQDARERLEAAVARVRQLRTQLALVIDPPTELRLFERGDYAEAPTPTGLPIGHTTLPHAATRVRPPSLTLSFDTPEDRERLADLLAVRTVRQASGWTCRWPAVGGDELRLDLEGAA